MAMVLSVNTVLKAEEFHAVIFCHARIIEDTFFVYPGFPLKRLGIVEHRYWTPDVGERIERSALSKELKDKYKNICKPLDITFIDNLKKSKFLYIGQYSTGVLTPLFQTEYHEAIKEVLEKGGVLFFEYLATPPKLSPADSYLKSIGVESPGPAKNWKDRPGRGSYYAAAIYSKDEESTPLNTPGFPDCYGWWDNWSIEQVALLRMKDDTSKAAMIIQEEVLGKGTVIFNQFSLLFRKELFQNPELKHAEGLLQDILAYAYPSLKGIKEQ